MKQPSSSAWLWCSACVLALASLPFLVLLHTQRAIYFTTWQGVGVPPPWSSLLLIQFDFIVRELWPLVLVALAGALWWMRKKPARMLAVHAVVAGVLVGSMVFALYAYENQIYTTTRRAWEYRLTRDRANVP